MRPWLPKHRVPPYFFFQFCTFLLFLLLFLGFYHFEDFYQWCLCCLGCCDGLLLPGLWLCGRRGLG